jgi:hypothetical protein
MVKAKQPEAATPSPVGADALAVVAALDRLAAGVDRLAAALARSNKLAGGGPARRQAPPARPGG